jgi:serine/threonine protein kinase
VTKLRFEHPGGESFEAELGGELATGGNGRVLEAKPARPSKGIPEELVVKHATDGGTRLIDLEREACERLDHPSLVRYYGAARSPELGTVLAFERLAPNPHLLLNGERRRPRFRDPGTTYFPLPPPRALELAFDLLLGLEHIHARGWVHCDVKLANLLVRTPAASGDAGRVLERVAEGAFEGVLIDLGSVRTQDALDALSRGEEDPELIPRLTPLYAPPEVLFERGELGGRKHFTPALDGYAFTLVFYVLLTGRIPYGHLASLESLQNRELVIELKLRESRGEISPIDERALDVLPLHDVAFEGDVQREWPSFRMAVAHVLRRGLAVDPRERLGVSAARLFFEEEFRMRTTGSSGSRPWTQGLFQMRPRANRILGDEPRPNITIREEKGQLVVHEGARPLKEESAAYLPPIDVGDGSTLKFRRTRGSTSTLKVSAVPPPPRNMLYLASVLREFKAGKKLPVTTPVLVTRTGFSPKELVRCLVFSLEAACARVRVDVEGKLTEERRAIAGRGEDADVVLSDKLVSKRHCVFEKRPDGWWVEDLSSANGTVISGQPLVAGTPVRLRGSLVTIDLGPTAKLTFMDERAFLQYLEQALEAWRQAFGRGNTGRLERQSLTATATDSPSEILGNTKSPSGLLRLAGVEKGSTVVEGADDAPTESSPQPWKTPDDVTKRVPAEVLKEIRKAPGAMPADLEARIRELEARDATFEFILDGARIETPDELDDILELLKSERDAVVVIEARLTTGERVTLFRKQTP